MKKYSKVLAISLIALSIICANNVYADDNSVEKEFSIEVVPNGTKSEKNFKVDEIKNKTVEKSSEKNTSLNSPKGINSKDLNTNRPKEKNFEIDVKPKDNITVDSNLNNQITREDIREILDEYKRENIKNRVNPLATPQSSARGSIIENVGADNKPYPIRRKIEDKTVEVKKDDKNKDVSNGTDRKKADARQFLTFKTKSGKVFHLIVDHDENSENVSLVTEVSEADLLNMIETKDKDEIKPQIEVKKEEPKKVDRKEPKKNSVGSFVIIGILLVGVLGTAYYFKIVKPKKDEVFDDEELEDDEEFFASEENDIEDKNVENNENVDERREENE